MTFFAAPHESGGKLRPRNELTTANDAAGFTLLGDPL
jgi:hypothetical protein